MKTVVYTDGACSGNPGPGGWAWAVPSGPYAAGPEKHTTNQRMEVSAVLEALRFFESGEVEIVSDSTYVINCFRDRWWEGWLKRNWTNSQKKPVANRDLWEPLIDVVRSRQSDISFRWVKGHSGDPMNDLVDALAVEACKAQAARSGDKAPVNLPIVGKTKDAEVPKGHLLLVTGHKPPEIGGYGPNATADAIRAKLAEIISAKQKVNADLVVITGLGLGVEQLAAEAALSVKVPFVAVLPYPDPHSVWPAKSQEHYKTLIDQAEGEVLLQAIPPENKQKAGAALNRHAAWLARHVDEAVVVWNGEESYVGKVCRSLQDSLGETEVWTINPAELLL